MVPAHLAWWMHGYVKRMLTTNMPSNVDWQCISKDSSVQLGQKRVVFPHATVVEMGLMWQPRSTPQDEPRQNNYHNATDDCMWLQMYTASLEAQRRQSEKLSEANSVGRQGHFCVFAVPYVAILELTPTQFIRNPAIHTS